MRWLAGLILKLAGWHTVLAPLPAPKVVIIVYPHTSNWDFVFGMLCKTKFGLNVRWVGKDTLFRGPFKSVFSWLGGIPVNRREHTGMIEQLVQVMANHAQLALCLAPEGTRTHTDHLKSGFYHIALAANAPLGLGFIDYRQKRVGIAQWVQLSGDSAADLNTLRAAYADKIGRYPEKASSISFKAH